MSTISVPNAPPSGTTPVPLSSLLDAAGNTAIAHVAATSKAGVATPVSSTDPMPVGDTAVATLLTSLVAAITSLQATLAQVAANTTQTPQTPLHVVDASAETALSAIQAAAVAIQTSTAASATQTGIAALQAALVQIQTAAQLIATNTTPPTLGAPLHVSDATVEQALVAVEANLVTIANATAALNTALVSIPAVLASISANTTPATLSAPAYVRDTAAETALTAIQASAALIATNTNPTGGAFVVALATALTSMPGVEPLGTLYVADTLGASTATDGSAGNTVTRKYILSTGYIVDTYTYGANSAVNGNPVSISRANVPYASTFTAALSATSVVVGTPVTLTLTPVGGDWPIGTSLTPSVSFAATVTPVIAPSGSTPATFTITPTVTGTGTITIAASAIEGGNTVTLGSSSGSLPVTSTVPPSETATITTPTGSFTAGSSIVVNGSVANGTTVYISTFFGGAEQLPRTAATVTGSSWSGSVTPAAAGSYTISAYAAATGGAALATTGSITVAAAPAAPAISSVVIGANGTTITTTLSAAAALSALSAFTLSNAMTVTWTNPGTAATTFVGTLSGTVYSGATVTYSTTSTTFTSPALTANVTNGAVTNSSTQVASGFTAKNVPIATGYGFPTSENLAGANYSQIIGTAIGLIGSNTPPVGARMVLGSSPTAAPVSGAAGGDYGINANDNVACAFNGNPSYLGWLAPTTSWFLWKNGHATGTTRTLYVWVVPDGGATFAPIVMLDETGSYPFAITVTY